MTNQPRTKDEIYDSLKSSLQGKIAKLTNFTERSFNYVWSQAFSEEIRNLEVLATVSELAGWIDYSGGPVVEEDLEDLGIADDVSADEINEVMNDDYLDEFIKVVGVQRFEGSRATGTVTITTVSGVTTIPEETRITTPPDSDGDKLEFETTNSVETADGVTSVSDVPIRAVNVGSEYNVPADTIVRFADPPIGVKSVTNPEATTGGDDRETNDELRARAKQAVQSSSLGGTVDGIKGYLRQNIEGVSEGDVIIEELVEECPPYVDVIVDGGLDSTVTDAIEFSRPAGIEHNLIRPQVIQVSVNTELTGTDIDTGNVSDDIENFLLDLGLNENYYNDELIRTIMQADEDIINIGLLSPAIGRVTNERYTYDDTKTDYRLDFTYESSNGGISVIDASGDTYTEGTNFTVEDQTGDGWPETLVWDTTELTPDDGETFSIDYDVTAADTDHDDRYATDLVRDETFTFEEGVTDTFTFSAGNYRYELTYVSFDGSTSVTDASGDTYTEGTDYEIFDQSNNQLKQTLDWRNRYLDGAVADDGGTTTDETAEANNEVEDDMTLLPETPAADDAYYFGSGSTFDRTTIDISTAGDGTWSLAWEYYDGTNWVALSGVTDGSDAFRNDGERDITWTVPGDWATTSVGGISGLYWVRARVTSFDEIFDQPLGRRATRNSNGTTPDDAEDFTVTYNKKVYHLEYEVTETPKGELLDNNGDLYEQDVDYTFEDYDNDHENEVLVWSSNPGTLADGEEFYLTYLTEGDKHISIREKVDPGNINVGIE